ncbi:molybdenum cofactor guanylyltransferase MobA [Thiobacter aerophilum]|uniref:Molybdenum cofactor guanylyltransferase n=1 Tax=Thiobacter aerophilum TaxID=3121275 RepID=A0ABV0EEA3_9BURK
MRYSDAMNDTRMPPVTGLILAGGEGRRMGGQDKGLMRLRGRPLAEWVLTRIRPQVSEVLISANRNLEAYGALGHPVLRDRTGGFVGPLAGIARGLLETRHPLLLAVPCDTPFLPDDLMARLYAALVGQGADLAVPVAAGRAQHAICLMRTEVGASLADYLARGGRKVQEWQAMLKRVSVDFGEEAAFFVNINRPEQLAALEALPHSA